MKYSNISLIAVLGLVSLILAGCNQQSKPDTQDAVTDTGAVATEHGKALNIVTTFPPLYAHTANLIDENDTLTNLVEPGTSVHTRQPKPSDVLAMEQADIIITNGLALEEFLDEYFDTLQDSGIVILDTSKGITIREFEELEEEREDGHDEDHHDDEYHDKDEHADEEQHDDHDDHYHHDHHHHHEGPDPHIRLTVDNAQMQLATITQALSELDPTQQAFYAAQQATYSDTLAELDQNIQALIDPVAVQPFIVFHDAYQYFTHTYGIADKQVGYVQKFHDDNPSQKDIAELLAVIEAESVATIYTEPQFNPQVVQRLEQEAQVTSREIDPLGSKLSAQGYIQLMTKLATAFSNQ